jgi:hypothetical protein
MNAPPAEVAIRPAPIQLAALARESRPDWDPVLIDGAIRGAGEARMPWPLVLVSFPRLMADPQADPRDLLKPLASPLVKVAGTEATAEWQAVSRALHAAAGLTIPRGTTR